MSAEDFDGVKQLAKENHANRVAQTPNRIEYAKKRFEQEKIEFKLKSSSNGHFHIFDEQGNLFQFWASTGKIWFDKKTKDARHFNSWYADYRGIESCIKLVKYIKRDENGRKIVKGEN